MAWKNVEDRRKYHREYYKKRVTELRVMLGNKCAFCKWDEYPGVLEFAHKKGEVKLFAVTQMKIKAWHRVVEEAQKCYLLCPTCHKVYDKYNFERREREMKNEEVFRGFRNNWVGTMEGRPE
jgi:hypothetical protein